MKFTRLLFLFLLFIPSLFAQRPPWGASDFDSYVLNVMKEFQVPGVSLAVVKDGKAIVAKGYGIRELGKPTPVDFKIFYQSWSKSHKSRLPTLTPS